MASFSVVNNIAAANAQANLINTNLGLRTSLSRLSSGLRINNSGDDAAGLCVASANDAYCRATGRTHEELIGRAFQEFITEEGRTRCSGIVRGTCETGSSRSEVLCSRKDGTTF